jgi:hypothetical protein
MPRRRCRLRDRWPWQRRLELIGRRDAGDFAGEDREAACRAGLAAAIRLRKDAAKLTGTRSEAGLPVTRFISRRMSAIPLCRMSAIPLYGNVGSKDRLAPQVIGRPRTRSAAFFVPALSWSAAMPCAVWRNRKSSLPRSRISSFRAEVRIIPLRVCGWGAALLTGRVLAVRAHTACVTRRNPELSRCC